MKKKSLLLLISAFFSIHLISQNDTYSYVFEGLIENVELYPTDKDGKLLSKKSTRNENGFNYFYQNDGSMAIANSKASIKVLKVYKGSDVAMNSLINIIGSSQDLTFYYNSSDKDSTIKFINNSTGHSVNTMISPTAKNERVIFFCEKDKNGNFYMPDNESKITFSSNYEKKVEVSNEPVIYAQGFNKTFYTKIELLNFLKKEKKINISSNDYPLEKKSPNVGEKLDDKYLSFILEENSTKLNEWLKLRPIKSSVTKVKEVATNDLILQISDERLLDSAGFKWQVFDISMICYNSGLFFDSFLAYIQYNTTVFGSNLIANNNIVADVDPAFLSSTYSNPNTVWGDISSNVIGIPFGTNSSGSYNRTLLKPIYQKVLTLKFKIQNCNNNTSISFTNGILTGNYSFYTTTANAPISSSMPMDKTYYSGSINDVACKPIITNFTDNVPAGINHIVTIDGKYFGTKKGTGTVIFRNADKGSQYPQVVGPNDGGLQKYDILSWQDDKIVLRLPTLIDSAVVTFGAEPPKIGSGYFKVKNSFLLETQSSTPITIPYALRQQSVVQPIPSIAYKKYTVKFAANNGNGYKIQLHPNLTSNPLYVNAKAVTRKAMKDWSCATGVNWHIGADTSLAFGQDAVCLINLSSMSGLMQTRPEIKPCLAANGEPIFYIKSFDIEINQSPVSGVWKVDSTGALAVGQLDFYAAIAHELGHGHLVQHINDSINDIMWWQAYPYGATLAQRKLLKYSFGARDGGNFVIDSLVSNLNCISNHVEIIPTKCDELIGIREIGFNLFNVIVSPNPSYSEQNITVKFILEKEENVNFEIYDITGKLILQTQTEKLIDVNYDLYTNQISAGVYLLKINVGSQHQLMKIIKQ